MAQKVSGALGSAVFEGKEESQQEARMWAAVRPGHSETHICEDPKIRSHMYWVAFSSHLRSLGGQERKPAVGKETKK